MKKILLALSFATMLFSNDIIVKESTCSVENATLKLKHILKKRGVNIFAVINHSANARSIGLNLKPAVMVVFGKPKLGTRLMQQDPTAGLDLPLRILIYKDKNNKTKIAYRNGDWIKDKHNIKAHDTVAKINKALDNITNQITKCD